MTQEPDSRTVTIVGAGIFGCTAAIALADGGFEVVLVELHDDILLGATKNNFNRTATITQGTWRRPCSRKTGSIPS